jgi:hypothetical protein
VKPGKLPTEKSNQTDWLLIGQLKLPLASTPRGALEVWLLETLQPFDLPSELRDTIKTSITEAVSKMNLSPIQSIQEASLKIFVSQDVKTARSSNRYWGFFRLEKVGVGSADDAQPEHILEYYLYLEK